MRSEKKHTFLGVRSADAPFASVLGDSPLMMATPHDPPAVMTELLGRIMQNPDAQRLLLDFADLNLTLMDGSVVSPMQLDLEDLVSHCQIPTVQRMAGFISELQTEQMESAQLDWNWMSVVITLVFVVVGIFGFVGNLFTVMVICRTPALRTQTNCFLANLAVSDLFLISVGVPFDLFYLWRTIGAPAFNGYCELTSTSISWFTYASILTITALSTERLVAICYPFRLKPYFHHQAVVCMIVAIWVVAFVPSLLIGLQFKPVLKDMCGIKRRVGNDFGTCDYVGDIPYIYEIMLLLTFALPAGFTIFCYYRILQTLNNSIKDGGNRDGRSHLPLTGRSSSDNSITRSGQLTSQSRVSGSLRSQKAQKIVVKMLLTVAFVFFVCYLPYHIERLFVHYYKKGYDKNSIFHMLYPLTGLLQYVSATVNPLIYNLMSFRFRKAFLGLWEAVFSRTRRKSSPMCTVPLNLKT